MQLCWPADIPGSAETAPPSPRGTHHTDPRLAVLAAWIPVEGICLPSQAAHTAAPSPTCVCRLLKDNGVLINVTYGEPSARVPLLQRLHFAVSFYMLSKEGGSGPAAAVPAGGSTGGIQMQGPLDTLSQVSRASRGHRQH